MGIICQFAMQKKIVNNKMSSRGRRSTQDNSLNPAMIHLLDISRLRKELIARGLDTKGNKLVLGDRLEEAMRLEKSAITTTNTTLSIDKTPLKTMERQKRGVKRSVDNSNNNNDSYTEKEDTDSTPNKIIKEKKEDHDKNDDNLLDKEIVPKIKRAKYMKKELMDSENSKEIEEVVEETPKRAKYTKNELMDSENSKEIEEGVEETTKQNLTPINRTPKFVWATKESMKALKKATNPLNTFVYKTTMDNKESIPQESPTKIEMVKEGIASASSELPSKKPILTRLRNRLGKFSEQIKNIVQSVPVDDSVQDSDQSLQKSVKPVQASDQPIKPVQDSDQLLQESIKLVQDSEQTIKPVQRSVQDHIQLNQDFGQPIQESIKPVQDTDLSIKAVQGSVQEPIKPVQDADQPLQESIKPFRDSAPPLQDQLEPVQASDQSIKPIQDFIPPIKPVQDFGQPLQDSVKPAQELIKPAQELIKPVQELIKPVQELIKPVQELIKPASSKKPVVTKKDISSKKIKPNLLVKKTSTISKNSTTPIPTTPILTTTTSISEPTTTTTTPNLTSVEVVIPQQQQQQKDMPIKQQTSSERISHFSNSKVSLNSPLQQKSIINQHDSLNISTKKKVVAQQQQRVVAPRIDLLDTIMTKQDRLLADKYKSEQEKAAEKQRFELEKHRNSHLQLGLGPIEKRAHHSSSDSSTPVNLSSPTNNDLNDLPISRPNLRDPLNLRHPDEPISPVFLHSLPSLSKGNDNVGSQESQVPPPPPPPPPGPPPPPPGPPPTTRKIPLDNSTTFYESLTSKLSSLQHIRNDSSTPVNLSSPMNNDLPISKPNLRDPLNLRHSDGSISPVFLHSLPSSSKGNDNVGSQESQVPPPPPPPPPGPPPPPPPGPPPTTRKIQLDKSTTFSESSTSKLSSLQHIRNDSSTPMNLSSPMNNDLPISRPNLRDPLNLRHPDGSISPVFLHSLPSSSKGNDTVGSQESQVPPPPPPPPPPEEVLPNSQHMEEVLPNSQHTEEESLNSQHTEELSRNFPHTEEVSLNFPHTEEVSLNFSHTEEVSLNFPHTEEVSLNSQHTEEVSLNSRHTEELSPNFQHTEVPPNFQNTEEVSLNSQHIEEVSLNFPITEEVSLNSQHMEEVSLNSRHTEEVSLNSQHMEEVSLNFQRMEEVSLNFQNTEEMSLNSQNTEELSPNFQHTEEVSLNFQITEEVSLNSQHMEEVSLNSRHTEEVSLNSQHMEEVSLNFQHMEEVSLNFQNTEEMSLNSQNTEEVSLNSQHTEEASLNSQHTEEVSLNSQPTLDIKETPVISNKALLKLASNVLKQMNAQNQKYAQLDEEAPYTVEDEKPLPDFYGEPVPDDEDEDDALFEMAAGISRSKKHDSMPIVIEEEPLPDDEFIELDYYNADMNIKAANNNKWLIDPDNADGFALMWGGVRSNYGIRIVEPGTSERPAKYAFQIKIVEFLSLKHVPFEELEPHDVRIGWSAAGTLNMLGEYPQSFAFCSLARKAHNKIFIDYGDPFHIGDVITTILDMENREIRYYKNDISLGTAFADIPLNAGDVVYPHIATKNCKVLVNFGAESPEPADNEQQPWIFPLAESDEAITMVGKLERRENLIVPSRRPPPDKTHCTVIVMVGLPGVGKTTWVRQYLRDHPNEHWLLLNTDTILNSMTVNGVPRRLVHQGRWDMIMGLTAKALNRSLQMACRRRHNYILDQTNVSKEARKRKLAQFVDFQRKCVVIIPSDDELVRRLLKQSRNDGSAGQIPAEAMLELKASFSIPCTETEPIEDVLFVEPDISRINEAIELVKRYNEEAKPWIRKTYKTQKPDSVISDSTNLPNQWLQQSGGVGGGGPRLSI